MDITVSEVVSFLSTLEVEVASAANAHGSKRFTYLPKTHEYMVYEGRRCCFLTSDVKEAVAAYNELLP